MKTKSKSNKTLLLLSLGLMLGTASTASAAAPDACEGDSLVAYRNLVRLGVGCKEDKLIGGERIATSSRYAISCEPTGDGPTLTINGASPCGLTAEIIDDNKPGTNKFSDWQTCIDKADSMTTGTSKIASCFNVEDNTIERSEVKFKNASPTALDCQAAYNKVSSGDTWRDLAKRVNQTPTASAFTSDQIERMAAVFMKKSTPTNSTLTEEQLDVKIGIALNKVLACVQVAAAFGENLKEGRDKEDPYLKPDKITSADGRISCELTGLETLDYDECSTLISTHNISQVGKVANTTIQTVQAQNFNSDQQQKLMNADATSNVTTLALRSQKEGIDKQQDMAEERRAVEAARLAAIGVASKNIPTSDDYFEDSKLCADPVGATITEMAQLANNGIKNETLNIDTDTTCRDNYAEFAFHENKEAKTAGYLIASEAVIDVAKETMVVSQLGKQKRMINSAIGKIEGMAVMKLPEDFFSNEDVYMQFCTANPTHAECQAGFGGSVNVPSFGSYNVGGFGTNQAYQAADSTDVTAATTASTTDPRSAGVDTSTAVTKSGGGKGLNTSVAGAKVTEGGAIAQGAGAGGSSPGGGGGGGSSAGGDPAAQAQGAGSVAGSSKLGYVGGGGPSFVGGRGSSKSRKPSSTNPFSNMFKKNSDRNLSSLNFKGQTAIGSKSDNIFQRISSAYDKANNEEKLLKYESTKSLE